MDAEILTQTLWAFAIAGIGLLAYSMANRVVLTRAANRSRGLDGFSPGIPAVLYFTAPTYTPCKTIQRPAI
jgi:hypothetical protein